MNTAASNNRAASRTERRRAAAAERAAAARRAERRRSRARWGAAVAATVAVFGTVAALALRGDGGETGTAPTAAPVVGGDLHTVASIDDALFVGGHAAAAVSRDAGKTWRQVPSLDGADAMGWAAVSDGVFVGGHPGIYRSTDSGETFTPLTGEGAVGDTHALGGSGSTIYAGSPQAGVIASVDGGRTWQVRNAQVGRSFMGTILVDPDDPARLIAPDMAGGLMMSVDGGRGWRSLGGPTGVMAVAWNPTDTRQIIAVGMDAGARSRDGGTTWEDIALPAGTSAVTYSADGRVLYAGALDGRRARIYRSTDSGATWVVTSAG